LRYNIATLYIYSNGFQLRLKFSPTPSIPLCLAIVPPLLPMEGSSASRKKGNGAVGWSEEISKDQFAKIVQDYIGQGAIPVKALIKVMAEQNISLEDLKSEIRKTPLL
jgi:hypothetical protein